MRNFKLGTVLIIFVLIISISPTTGATVPVQVDKATVSSISSKIDAKIQILDKNHDKIADSIKPNSLPNQYVIGFDKGYYQVVKSSLQALKVQNKIFMNAGAGVIFGNWQMLNQINKIPGVKIIEPNLKAHSYLAYSSSQIGTNPFFRNQGLTGAPSTSVAVLDTGIDGTNTAFGSRIIAWKDFIGASKDISGDEYSTPTDVNGHGSHVAGIVAGQPVQDNGHFFKVTEGVIPQTGRISLQTAIPNIVASSVVNVTLDWGLPGKDNPGSSIFLFIAQSSTPTTQTKLIKTDTSGFYSTTFTLPSGSYIASVGYSSSFSPINATGQKFNLKISLEKDTSIPTTSIQDYKGIAYTSNLVGLKVLDDSGNGTLSSVLAGVNWVLANHNTYNITVVNLSLGLGTVSVNLDTAINDLANAGVIPVVAAGNDGPNALGVGSPGSAALAITVGAVNPMNQITYYSSRGTSSFNSQVMKPDVLAPGGSAAIPGLADNSAYLPGLGEITSVQSNLHSSLGLSKNNLLDEQGTSMASPHIAGLAQDLIGYLINNGTYVKSLATVKLIKNAILATSFEVANIYGGAENLNGGLAASPTIDRTGKDYYEGWGAANAMAALQFLKNSLKVNSATSFKLSLLNPFQPKSYSATINLIGGTSYNFTVTVPSGADADLWVVNSAGNSNGEPQILASSTKTGSVNESLVFTPAQSGEYHVVVKLVNSANSVDNFALYVFDPTYTPIVDFIQPLNNHYYNSSSLQAIFSTPENLGQIYLDNVFLGSSGSPYQLPTLTEGGHNLTVWTSNPRTGKSAGNTSLFTIDITKPTLTGNLTNLNTDKNFIVTYSSTDNFAMANVSLYLGGTLAASSNTPSGSLTVNVASFPPGTYTMNLVAIDKAGNTKSITATLVLTHEIYFVPKPSDILEWRSSPQTITWEVYSNKPKSYSISIDGTNIINKVTWDGKPISFTHNFTKLGNFVLNLTVTTTTGITQKIFTALTIRDTLPPQISANLNPGIYDASNSYDLTFTYKEPFPSSVSVLKDSQTLVSISPWDGNLNFLPIKLSSSKIGITENYVIKITDSSGNTGTSLLPIEWRDLTKPLIENITNVLISNNELTYKFRVYDKFLANVNASFNDKLVFSNPTPKINDTYTINVKNLQPGSYTINIFADDLGGNLVQKLISFKLNKISSSANAGFLEIGVLPLIFSGLLIILIYNYHRRRN